MNPALLLFAAFVFALCFAVDKTVTAMKKRAQLLHRVRLPYKYPILSAAVLLVAIGCGIYAAKAGSALFTVAAVVFLGVSGYILMSYLTTSIDYDEDSFTFRRGREQKTFSFGDIDCQRVAINRGGCVLVLVIGKDEVVFYSNMQGFSRFLDWAFAGWCRQRGLDPLKQDWHDPRDHRWFPDDKEAEA